MKSARSTTPRPGPLATLAVVAACGVGDPGGFAVPAVEEVTRIGLELTAGARITYSGHFDWEGTSFIDGSPTFDNDLGYRFRIDVFQLATGSVQLRPCEPEKTASSGSWWGISRAHADHIVDNDPSMAIVDMAEDALTTSPNQLAVGTAAEGSYCQAFLLSAVLTESLPSLGDNTIALAGAYLPPYADSENETAWWVPFDVRIPLSEGMLEEIAPEAEPSQRAVDGGTAGDVNVLVTRYPVRAFASLDPQRFDGVEFAWEVLGNVLHGSTVRYSVR